MGSNQYELSTEIFHAFSYQAKLFLENYLLQQKGAPLADIYQAVLKHVERPLLELMLEYVNQNQSQAAIYLGLSRGTLRKKMKQYGLLA